jgi:ABC-type branched-subunit amino acid transport system substrate-binding protein
VALFLPFTGKNRELGWHLFNTAILSLFENDLNHNIELILIDSKESPKDSARAFKEVVRRKIKIVVGPIFSSSIEEIEKDAKQNNITVISLSNNQSLMGKTNENGGVFLAGILPETQVDKIVNYAIDRGKFSFAIIAPKNYYGSTVTSILKRIVKDRDGSFITSEFYETNGRDIDRAVAHVINSFSIPSALTEGRNKAKKDAVISEFDRNYPQVIMIPESGRLLSKIVESIKKQNVEEREFQIIGTSQWDDISTLNDRNLVGAWFAGPENNKFRNLEKAYYQTYGKFPPRISSIVYDMITAISEVVDQAKGRVPTIKDFTGYTNPPKNGFEGIDGLFRFIPNGIVQRNLAVLEVESGNFNTIQKPVDQFLQY